MSVNSSNYLACPIKSKCFQNVENECLKVSVCTMQGKRKSMEDIYVIKLNIIKNTSFICLCDGHNGIIILKFE